MTGSNKVDDVIRVRSVMDDVIPQFKIVPIVRDDKHWSVNGKRQYHLLCTDNNGKDNIVLQYIRRVQVSTECDGIYIKFKRLPYSYQIPDI